MIIAVASLKGGVGKTTTAIHLAAYLQSQANTLLIDAELNRSATEWAKRGNLPFEVVDEWHPPSEDQHFDHVVIDTQAKPTVPEMRVLTESCDLLILLTTTDILAIDALIRVLEVLKAIAFTRYRILLTGVPNKPSRDVEQLQLMLKEAGLPLFATTIRQMAIIYRATQTGSLVSEVKDPKAQEAWEDYQRMGQELLANFGL